MTREENEEGGIVPLKAGSKGKAKVINFGDVEMDMQNEELNDNEALEAKRLAKEANDKAEQERLEA